MKKHYCNIGKVKSKIDNLDPYNNKKYESRDEVTIGRLFADVFQDEARYNITSKSWYVYNGTIWEEDIEGLVVERYAKYLYKTLYGYAMDKERNYQNFVIKLGARPNRLKMILDAREHNFISQEMLDSNGDVLNVLNGVIDLRTFELLEHDPKYLLSKCANVNYDPSKRSEVFETFLSEIMCGDSDKTEYLQKILGIGLTSDNSEEECYMLYGATTRNGKSTLLETVAYMLGDYAMNMNPESLAQRKKDSRTASGDIARLCECRFLHMSEPPKRMVFDVALIKTLLGRDKITARELYQREFEFIPKFKLYINTNYLPIINDDSVFSSGRIKVITFDKHFEEYEQDKTLKNRLKENNNLSGILNWCIGGVKRYREEGLQLPESVVSATNDYREKSDKIKLFIEDCLVEDSSSILKASELYENFAIWCRSNGYGTDNKSNFFEELKTKHLLSDSGTINGKTVRNVIKGYRVDIDLTLNMDNDYNPFEVA